VETTIKPLRVASPRLTFQELGFGGGICYFCGMVYKVIGLMSGSSLDGLDIAHVQLEEVRGQWSSSILNAECLPYSDEWLRLLRNATSMSVGDFLKLDVNYGTYLGTQVNAFIAKYDLAHQVHFIASHGHTVFHEPQNGTTCQIGKGSAIATATGLPVINDLRVTDVALGGQGAPIVPIGDKLLFGDYDYLLNIGGIANITVQGADISPVAFDVCPANQVLNALAQREGKTMDEGGAMAASGTVLTDLLEELNDDKYYQKGIPKSLSNEEAMAIAAPLLRESSYSTTDLLHTAATHIAGRIVQAVQQYGYKQEDATILVTGGGTFNTHLVDELQRQFAQMNITIVVPDAATIQYKEALVMALIGTLRWREEVNVLSSVTGAARDSVGGALWLS